MGEKKDILDMDFGKVSVPQAIMLSLQAATKCVTGTCDEQENVYLDTDNDRLIELAEKLEGRVEDALDEKVAPVKQAELEALEEPVDWSDVALLEDGAIANIRGGVYIKACNEPVITIVTDGEVVLRTFCIKQWGHKALSHEDADGDVRV